MDNQWARKIPEPRRRKPASRTVSNIARFSMSRTPAARLSPAAREELLQGPLQGLVGALRWSPGTGPPGPALRSSRIALLSAEQGAANCGGDAASDPHEDPT